MKNQLGILSGKVLINRSTYSGRGRPRKSDYYTLKEAQDRLNQLRNQYLDYLRFRI